LKFCGGHKLERLLLDGSFITVGKKNSMGGKDVLVIIRELFSMLPSLKEIDLTNAHISSEILNAILTGNVSK
jgi:hypothetical protein